MDGKTLVTFLLDRTGSMASIKSATIEAFNGYLDGLKADPNGHADELIDFTFLKFDSMSLHTVCVAEPVGKVAPLTDATFIPRASTPLIDACVKTIRAVEKSLTSRADKPKIIVCFQTDGHENASTEHTWDELNRLITDKTKEGWQFNFLGVGLDAYDQAQRMGIDFNSTIAPSRDALSMRASFAASASNSRAYAKGSVANTNYSNHQRTSSGDRFYGGRTTGSIDLTQPTVPTPPVATSKPKERRASLVEEPKL